MKKVMMLLVVFGMVLGVSSVMADKGGIPNGGNSPVKVEVCHFPGHEGDALITGQGFGCIAAGGNVIEISASAVPAHVD